MELAQEEVTSWLPGQGTSCRVACPGGGAGREGCPSTPEWFVSAARVTAPSPPACQGICRASSQRARGSLRFGQRGCPEDEVEKGLSWGCGRRSGRRSASPSRFYDGRVGRCSRQRCHSRDSPGGMQGGGWGGVRPGGGSADSSTQQASRRPGKGWPGVPSGVPGHTQALGHTSPWRYKPDDVPSHTCRTGATTPRPYLPQSPG